MNKIYCASGPGWRCLWIPGCVLALTLSWVAVGQGSPPTIQPVALSSQPLHTLQHDDKPTVTLALSITYPVAGAQHRDPASPDGSRDQSYTNTTEYLGYWDADSCYTYYAAGGMDTTTDPQRFVRTGPAGVGVATQRTCADAFSGNFLNWASASAIDVLRMALTGGDRILDTTTRTVVQRAVLPDGKFHSTFQSATPFFPRKLLSAAGGSSGKRYFGAVPQAMAAYTDGAAAIVVQNVRNEIYFSSTSDPDENDYVQALPGQPYFFARVEVCGQDTGGALVDKRPWALCTRQPGGNYKPTGALQKYADRVRVAVLGYVTDPDPTSRSDRYGAVLRAPMKFMGHRTFDALGTETTPPDGNPSAEWDFSTGVFRINPLQDAVFGVSGVVNYINRFGRNGHYKDRDPLGELHLEALRYLQGQSPTSAATVGLNGSAFNGLYGGLPAYSSWTDPYAGRDPASDYTCHRAHILAIGDPVTRDHGTIAPAQANRDMPDISYWGRVVQQFENNEAGSYADAVGITRRISGRPGPANAAFPSPAAPHHFQVVGAAYWAHTHDIRDLAWTSSLGRAKHWRGLRVTTLVYDVSREGTPGTYRDSNSLFMAAKYGGYAVNIREASGGAYNQWGNPFLQSGDGTAQDVGTVTQAMGPRGDAIWASQTAGREGVAHTYYRADASALATIKAIDALWSRAVSSASTHNGGAIPSRNLAHNGNTLYQSTVDASDWSGDLLAYPVHVGANGQVSVGNEALWSAGAQLNAMPDPVRDRNIIVGNTDGPARPVAVEFRWDRISSALQAALNKPSPTEATDHLGEQRLNFLRGDRTPHANFRPRYQRMGDVIHSGAVYSGAPSSSVSSSRAYATFLATHANRTPMVAVGANDGMLHAFHAGNGTELFAYIPSWVAPQLPALTRPDYADNHRSYVDGTPAVGEAELRSRWATVLVSGTGGGGKGVFALDVTDPSTVSAAQVLWEFTAADDPDFDLGQSVGAPQILKFRTSAPGAARATYQWFAVVGNGVNSYVPDAAGRFSATGKPALYLLDLGKPAGQAWAAGGNYFKVSFPTNPALNSTTAAGMVNFTAVLDADQAVDTIYVGDLQGHLWKLNFASHGTPDWTLARLSAFSAAPAAGGAPVPIPMFTAKDAAGRVQPITAAPSVTARGANSERFVAFGTGKYLEAADIGAQSVQSVYVLYDDGLASASAAGSSQAIAGRAVLQAGGLETTTGKLMVPPYTPGHAKTPYSNVKSGWYFDFPSAGERQVASGSLVGEKMVFASLIPHATAGTGACAAAGAGGVQYLADVRTGDGVAVRSAVGVLSGLQLLDLPGATVYSAADGTGRKSKTVLTKVIQQGSSGWADSNLGGLGSDRDCPPGTPTGVVCTRITAGRLSWRQVSNYHELQSQPW